MAGFITIRSTTASYIFYFNTFFLSYFNNIAMGVNVPELDISPTGLLFQADHCGYCHKVLLGTSILDFVKNDLGNKIVY